MTDAPPEALNFVEAAQESPTSIETDRETFETEEDGIPTIDTLKETFEDEPASADDDDREPRRERGTNPRRSLFILLDEPDSSALARVISVVLMLMIFSSSVSFVMETTDPVQNDPDLKEKLHVRPMRPWFPDRGYPDTWGVESECLVRRSCWRLYAFLHLL